jgi:capsular polysaccharide biosynthesis protein
MKEITLKDFIRIMFKWKYLILWVIVLAVVISSVFNFFVFKNVFKGVATVFPAQIGNTSFPQQSTPVLSSTETLQIVMSDDFMQKLANKLNIPLSELKGDYKVEATQTQSATQWSILVSFESTDKNLIRSFLDEFVVLLNDYVKVDFNQQIDSLKEYISQLNSQVAAIDARLSDISTKMLQLVNKDGTVKSEYYLEYATLRDSYETLFTQETQLKQQIANLNLAIKNSNLFYYPNGYSILERPVKPRKLFNTAVAGITAFLFSILLVFFLEYWQEPTGNGSNV